MCRSVLFDAFFPLKRDQLGASITPVKSMQNDASHTAFKAFPWPKSYDLRQQRTSEMSSEDLWKNLSYKADWHRIAVRMQARGYPRSAKACYIRRSATKSIVLPWFSYAFLAFLSRVSLKRLLNSCRPL